MKKNKLILDMELLPIFTVLAEKKKDMPTLQKGDWQSVRTMGNSAMDSWNDLLPDFDDVEINIFSCLSHDNTEIELRWYTKKNVFSQAAVTYIHGGGMILGDLNRYDKVVSNYVSQTGVPFLAMQYRIAPEAKDEIPAQDALAALKWLNSNASKLNVDTNRIAIMGDSAGGGIAAGTAILAREHNIFLKQQILIYPPKDLECATICTAAAQLMSMGGTHAGKLCKLCAEVCEECAIVCESYSIPHCQECAQACRKCVTECEKMAA